MKVVIGAGGTGGHLYPALALVEYIEKREPGSEFLFIGTLDRLESRIVPEKGYPYLGLNVKGMVGNPLQKAKSALLFLMSIGKAKKAIKAFDPDIVIGFGGYPSASAVKGAHAAHYKTIMHEQNSIIGLTNKILIKDVDRIVCCYEKAYNEFPKEKTLLLGNPRASVVANVVPNDIYEKYGLDRNKRLVTIVMGSLGSSSVNAVMEDALKEMSNKDYNVLYVTGNNYYDDFVSKVKVNDNVKIVPYIDDMPSVLSYCDLLVSRAGATTIAELTSIGTPALLIPSPYVAANHQEFNARELVDRGAADMILEKDFNATTFVEKVDHILGDADKVASMKEAAKAMGKPNACEDIYNLVLEVLEG